MKNSYICIEYYLTILKELIKFYIMDEKIIKNFEAKLNLFQNSLIKVSDQLMVKLEKITKETKQVVLNTDFLKKMKVIYDEQNKKLQLMEKSITDLSLLIDKVK